MITPLICFYQNKKIISYDYDHFSTNDRDWRSFLKNFEETSQDRVIIVKMDFEAGMLPQQIEEDSINTKNFKSNLVDIFVLNNFEEYNPYQMKHAPLNLFPMMSKNNFGNMFKSSHEKIEEGGFYQINLSFPFAGDTQSSPTSIFNNLSNKFSGSYHALIPTPHYSLLSFSPEQFLMKRGNTLSTSPIKGTISKNVKNYEAILLESQKESAELSMIVDLLRNDISRASDISPSKVIKHREIMDLGNLVHTYSTIESETSLNLCEILWETLPGGSISGCPKREAVLNILKLEPYARGPYTGICGWWHKDNFELNILIRSLVLLPNGKCFYSAGGGIVYDSKCNMEYDEILLKAEMIREKTDD